MIDIDCYDLKDCPDGDCENCSISPAGAKWKEPEMEKEYDLRPYVKRFFRCPCGPEGEEWGIEHLLDGTVPRGTAGPWYCHTCGVAWNIEIKGPPGLTVKLTDSGRRCARTLVILKLDPKDMDGHPLFFMTEGVAFAPNETDGGEPVISPGQDEYFYNEHTCPTNWLKRVREIAIEGDHDPHGLFRYVETRPFTDEPLEGPELFMQDKEEDD